MGDILRSKDDQINLTKTYGAWNFGLFFRFTSATAATTTSGLHSMARSATSITTPSLGTGVTGMYLSRFDTHDSATGSSLMVAAETSLGTLAMISGTFSAGSAMPTATVKGTSVTSTVAQMVVAHIDSTLTATTPVITITYVNQDGTGSRTATLTLPTNANGSSCYLVYPHLQSGDTGIRSITNATKSAGTGGTIRFYGLQVLNMNPATQNSQAIHPETHGILPWIVGGSKQIGFYRMPGTTAGSFFANLTFLPDN